jgi:hypothetical protein
MFTQAHKRATLHAIIVHKMLLNFQQRFILSLRVPYLFVFDYSHTIDSQTGDTISRHIVTGS